MAVASASRSEVRRADHSAAALTAVLTSTTALVGGVESPLPMLWGQGPWGILAVLVLASVFAIGTAVAGWRFISAVSICPGEGILDVRIDESFEDELWRLSTITAAAAAAKYRRIRRGIPWLGLAAGTAYLWCLLGTLS